MSNASGQVHCEVCGEWNDPLELEQCESCERQACLKCRADHLDVCDECYRNELPAFERKAKR